MKRNRLIPVLLLKNGWLVQSKGFKKHQNLGNPLTSVQRLSDWACDELVYLDISREPSYDLRREDLRHPNRSDILKIIEDVSRVCFMPLTFGGGIRTLESVGALLAHGADKIAINSEAVERPDFIGQVAREFGSQCVVVSIDARSEEAGGYRVWSQGGRTRIDKTPAEWAREAEQRGAGEILLNSINRDGARTGYDLELLRAVCDAVKIPVIACGGVGEWQHFADALEQTSVDAVAAANIFHYSDQSVYLAKKFLFERGFNVRPPDFLAGR